MVSLLAKCGISGVCFVVGREYAWVLDYMSVLHHSVAIALSQKYLSKVFAPKSRNLKIPSCRSWLIHIQKWYLGARARPLSISTVVHL